MVCFWWKRWALEELNSWDIPLPFFHFSLGISLSQPALALLLPHLLPSKLGSRWGFMHFPSCDPFLLHQQRFQLHPRPRRCKFLQNELTLKGRLYLAAKHSPDIGFTALTHKHRAQHSQKSPSNWYYCGETESLLFIELYQIYSSPFCPTFIDS